MRAEILAFGLSACTQPGAAAFTLKAAVFHPSPDRCKPDKSIRDKIRQQLQVLRDPNLLEFLTPGHYRLV